MTESGDRVSNPTRLCERDPQLQVRWRRIRILTPEGSEDFERGSSAAQDPMRRTKNQSCARMVRNGFEDLVRLLGGLPGIARQEAGRMGQCDLQATHRLRATRAHR